MKNWTAFNIALGLIVLSSLTNGYKASAHETFVPTVRQVDSATARKPRQSLSSLPVAAQATVIATLARDDPRYQVKAVQGALRAQNPAQSLRVNFTSTGIQTRGCGGMQWRMALRAYGYGDRLETMRELAPHSEENRVEYRRGPLVEWYVNAPTGLEQGFTISAPPARAATRSKNLEVRSTNPMPLTIALGLGGDLTPTVDSPAKGERVGRAKGLTLRDSDGRAVLRYTGLTAHDASGRELVAWLELDRHELRMRVEDAGALYPVVVDPFLQVTKLTASDGSANDYFGRSVAVSGNGRTIVVGSTFGAKNQDGAVFVFVNGRTGWTQAAKLTASDEDVNDGFGASVSASSDARFIVAGAPGPNIDSNYSGGAAYVFVRRGTGWIQTAKLTASDGAAGDFMGLSAAISSDGRTIVAGAFDAMIGSNSQQGAAYVFVRRGSAWLNATQTAKLTASDGEMYDSLGFSVGISGNGRTIVVGAPQATVGSNYSQGAAYLFAKPVSGWTTSVQTAKLTASDGRLDDSLGWVGISSDGRTIAAGAPGANAPGGALYVYVKPILGWTTATQTAKLTTLGTVSEPETELGAFSVSVSRHGRIIATGAEDTPIGSNSEQGAVYIFRKPAMDWIDETQTAKLTASDGKAGDLFGRFVALSGDGLIVAASSIGAKIDSNADQGAVYVFEGRVSPPLGAEAGLFGLPASDTDSLADSSGPASSTTR
jgi:hypothetical protein